MRLLLGVTGGIAAYKALELTRLALKAGHQVRVVMTEAATRFVGPASFAAITGAPVLVSEFKVASNAYEGALRTALRSFYGAKAPEVSQGDSISSIGQALASINAEVVR